MLPYLKNIYLADDDSDDIEFFQTVINELNPEAQITVSYNGEELLNQLEKSIELPDIIFLDINMPKINGLDALKIIKLIDVINTIPVIMCSTGIDDSYVKQAYALGAHYYIVKPSDFSVFKRTINNIFSQNLKLIRLPVNFSNFIFR